MSGVSNIVINPELRKRILFTLGVLIVYRIGVHVPTPGVDATQVIAFFQSQAGGIFGLFNTFTGGALEQFSIFALGIMPYISSSIIFQLLTAVVPALESLKKEGQQGQKKINQYTRYGTIVLAVIQGYGISTFLKSQTNGGIPLVHSAFVGPIPFELMTIITLTAGTCFIMWLGEQITERGIGNGVSLIIFSGIVAGIPSGFMKMLNLINQNQLLPIVAIAILALMIVVIGAIIFLETGQRRIPIQHSQRQAGRTQMSSNTNYLPLKLNFSGVIPPIFASSLLMFPATIAQFSQAPWLINLRDSLSFQGPLFNIAFVGLITFFCFFYTEVVFNPSDVAENLKKNGGFIPGIRSGTSTSEYIMKVLNRINVGGAMYISAICIMPTLISNYTGIPFQFGGTSLLIVVGVALDTTQQIQSYLISQKYESFLKGTKIRGRRVQY
ncbi:MAG: preprotein translocase subunit SecY [Bdellovibrionota bacterium]